MRIQILFLVLASTVVFNLPNASAQLVPGTGRQLIEVGDDFEDENWGYVFQNPKSTENIDDQRRQPAGYSSNGRWYEGIKRGHPDVIRRVKTPAGGLSGSKAALELISLKTGIPGRPSYKLQQDDFICASHTRIGTLSVSRQPSAVTRVYLPPFEEWENRSGASFAFRLSLVTTITKPGRGIFKIGHKKESELYWPGMFLCFNPKEQTRQQTDSAYIRIRGGTPGGDFKGMDIQKLGWWTLGMSVSRDGKVHYYAKPGVEDLTARDHITSQFPYGYRAEKFKTFFYNVCNGDDNRTWSTKWVIDDPKLYVTQ